MSTGRAVQITAITHQGCVRTTNEDTIAVAQWVRNLPMMMPYQWYLALEEPIVCVVADGMGGHASGEIASKHVATRISQEVLSAIEVEKLHVLLQRVNGELYDLMAADTSHAGMGTTVVGLVLSEDRLIWFNIGDSRLYRHRNGFLRQISIDDVPNPAKSEDAGDQRKSHAITQSLGGSNNIQHPRPNVGTEDLTVPSRWLLCSDGLTDLVGIDAMEACMTVSDLDAVAKLAQLAMQAGGEDNISIIVLSVTHGPNLALIDG